jgi:hypothetical protein
VNQQHLAQLIEDLEKLPDEQFDMSQPDIDVDTPVLPCGCIGAWVRTWHPSDNLGNYDSLIEYLDISRKLAASIYLGNFSKQKKLKDITKQEAIEYLKTLQEC